MKESLKDILFLVVSCIPGAKAQICNSDLNESSLYISIHSVSLQL